MASFIVVKDSIYTLPMGLFHNCIVLLTVLDAFNSQTVSPSDSTVTVQDETVDRVRAKALRARQMPLIIDGGTITIGHHLSGYLFLSVCTPILIS